MYPLNSDLTFLKGAHKFKTSILIGLLVENPVCFILIPFLQVWLVYPCDPRYIWPFHNWTHLFSSSVPEQSLKVTSLSNWSCLTTLQQFAASPVNISNYQGYFFAFIGIAALLTKVLLNYNSMIMTETNNIAKL